MSTILKALKQAEKDSPDQGDENRPSFNVRTALSSRVQQQKKSSFLSLGRIVILVALVIVIAIFSYSLFILNKNIHPQTTDIGKRSQVLDTQPDSVKDQTQTNAESVIESSDLPEALMEILPKSAVESFDPLKPVDEPETIPDDKAPLIVKDPTLSHSEKEDPKDPIKDEKEIVNKNKPEQAIPLLENDSLRVQAISWSENPASRIAVIDNRVLKEGDSVQGYRLVIIEQDAVILHYSGSDYRLGFQYR